MELPYGKIMTMKLISDLGHCISRLWALLAALGRVKKGKELCYYALDGWSGITAP